MGLPKTAEEFLKRYDTFQPKVGKGQTKATEEEGDDLLPYWLYHESQVKVYFEEKPRTKTWDAKRQSIVDTMQKFTEEKARTEYQTQ